MKLLDLLIERRQQQEKYFKNYLFYAEKIKKTAEELLGEVKVFVFGSILRKDEVPKDIDILIISPEVKTTEQKSKMRFNLWQKLGFLSPFEIHLITPEEHNDWYRYFIKDFIEVG